LGSNFFEKIFPKNGFLGDVCVEKIDFFWEVVVEKMDFLGKLL